MATFIIYAIRWALTLTLLYSFYRLLLGRETFHRLNRAVLLGILVLSPLLPLVPMQTEKPTTMNVVLSSIKEPLLMPMSTAPQSATVEDGSEPTISTSGTWIWIAAYIYIIGIVIGFAVYLFRLITLARLIHRSRRITHPMVPEGVRLMLNMGISHPSSWMHWIFIGPIDLKQNATSVLTHEMAHVRLRHSWDLVLCDVACRLLWCLPFAWMLRQDLVDVHEFQADEAVLRHGVTRDDYEHLLVRKAVRVPFLPVQNTLRRGAVKKRFAMMHSHRSSSWARLKLLYLLPALAVCLWVSAQTEEYEIYLNGKPWASLRAEKFYIDHRPVTKQEMDAIDPAKIHKIDVLHSEKAVYIETKSEPVDTGGVMPGVRPEDAYFTSVEQMPEFRGGRAAFDQYIARNVKYPKIAAENGVKGMVNVAFIVEEDGSITNIQVAEMEHTRLEDPELQAAATKAMIDEAKRLVRLSSGKWNPGRQQGRAVRVKMSQRIAYILS